MSDQIIPVGGRGAFAFEVEEKHCTRRGEHSIFSTPNMVQLLEWAAMEALRPHLSEAQITVGTKVDVRHLAPTPKGMHVRAEATVRESEGARVLLDVEIFDDAEKIGEAVHERYVLDRDRYLRRLEKKIAATRRDGR